MPLITSIFYNWLRWVSACRRTEWIAATLLLGLGIIMSLPPTMVTLVPANAGKNQTLQMTDFVIYYAAGRIANEGHPDKTYDISLQKYKQSEIMEGSFDVVLPHLYPPQSMVFFAPLAMFSLYDAYLIWQGCNFLLYLALIIAMQRLGYAKHVGALFSMVVLMVISRMLFENTLLGQCNVLMLAGLLGAYTLLRREYYAWAACVFLFTAYKPQILFIPLLYMLFSHHWRFSLWMAIISVLFFIAALPIFGIDIWHVYAHALSDAIHHLGADYGATIMPNMRSLLYTLWKGQTSDTINHIATIIWGVIAVMIAGFAYTCRNQSAYVKDTGFALAITAACFFSPYVQLHTLIFLFVPVVIIASQSGIYAYAATLIIITLVHMIGSFDYQLHAWQAIELAIIACLIYKLRRNWKRVIPS